MRVHLAQELPWPGCLETSCWSQYLSFLNPGPQNTVERSIGRKWLLLGNETQAPEDWKKKRKVIGLDFPGHRFYFKLDHGIVTRCFVEDTIRSFPKAHTFQALLHLKKFRTLQTLDASSASSTVVFFIGLILHNFKGLQSLRQWGMGFVPTREFSRKSQRINHPLGLKKGLRLQQRSGESIAFVALFFLPFLSPNKEAFGRSTWRFGATYLSFEIVNFPLLQFASFTASCLS